MFARLLILFYAIASYAVFFVSFLYGLGFVGNYLVPKSIDVGGLSSVPEAIVVDLALVGIFAIQQSIMARPAFKRWWAGILPVACQRSTYVLLSSLILAFFALRGAEPPHQSFKTPLLYKIVRHPLMLGLLLAYWATPEMTAGHLLFAIVNTAYILVGLQFEERDLIAEFGTTYQQYRRRVPMLLPRIFGHRRTGASR